jgi:flagellar basal-body rod protein FlgG
MFRSLHIAATGMAAQEAHLDGISNNIANANTVGYKRQRVEFQDLLYQTIRAPGSPTGATTMDPSGVQLGSGVRVAGTARGFSQGSLLNTDNPLDVAIEGNGFFAVQQADGTMAYTRAGSLQTDGQGRLVTPEGLPLDPPVVIPPDAQDVAISPDGTVTALVGGDTTPVELGQLSVATFQNPGGLYATGHNLYRSSPASGEASIGRPGEQGRGTLLQGSIEQANVNIVEEMVGLISAQRAYEMNSKVIHSADEMMQSAARLK